MRKTRLLTLLLLLMTAVTGAWAQTWDSGDCTLTLSEGVMTVSGTGAMANYAKSSATPWYSDRTDVETVVIESGVTSIGDNAFANCIKLESVSIPASVTSIGENAFSGCGSVAAALTVSFAEGSTLESIGNYAFMSSNLTSISIPASVTSIGQTAFGFCDNLAKVYIYAPSLTTYGGYAFENNASGRKIYVLPEAVDTYKTGWSAYDADIKAMTFYATSVKSGTEDSENWSATPSPATEGQKVTINYAGTKSVKSVTAKRKTTTGNFTVYFTDVENYGDVHVYYWNDGPAWPGTPMTEVGTNDYNQKIYRAEIPATAVGIIFNNNNNRQTVDITDNIEDGSWWYTTDQLDGWKNEVGYVGKYTENIEVTNVDANNWTFTMPDGNVELDIEYYPAHSVTISDGDVDAANWSATPTEQSFGQNVTLQYTGRKKIKRITIVPAPTARTAAEATAEDLGKLIGADGNIYDDAAAATAASTTAVAMIAYVGSGTEHATYTHGLAIALADESNSNWNMAKSTCEGKSAVTKAAWLLPSQNQWKAMFGANGGNEGSYSGLNTALANAGGTALQGSDGLYWTSTDSSYAYSHFMAYLNGGSVNFWEDDDNNSNRVRACLVF
ncbi:MAG: leucine-rich repeat protein [Prevotella sp.]|nr:leucine-rich repeat protein [Prevotella sp.]